MLVICTFLIIILVVIYFKRPYENILESLKYTKTLLKDINYKYNDKLILPPILHMKNLNTIKISIKPFPLLLVPDIGGSRLYAKWNMANIKNYNDICSTTRNYYTQIWPSPQCLSPFVPFANCWKVRFAPKKFFLDKNHIQINLDELTRYKLNRESLDEFEDTGKDRVFSPYENG